VADQNWAYVTASFVATWIVIIGYAVHVHRTLAAARRAYDEATARRPEEVR
jgi:hypothetical protein